MLPSPKFLTDQELNYIIASLQQKLEFGIIPEELKNDAQMYLNQLLLERDVRFLKKGVDKLG